MKRNSFSIYREMIAQGEPLNIGKMHVYVAAEYDFQNMQWVGLINAPLRIIKYMEGPIKWRNKITYIWIY